MLSCEPGLPRVEHAQCCVSGTYNLSAAHSFLTELYIRQPQAGPSSNSMVWEAISYNSRSHLVFLLGKVNSARYMHKSLTPCYWNFFERKVMCFFSRTTHVHMSVAHALLSVEQLPWPAITPVLSNNHGRLARCSRVKILWRRRGERRVGEWAVT